MASRAGGAGAVRRLGRNKRFAATPDMMSLVGGGGADFDAILTYLGYGFKIDRGEKRYAAKPKPRRKPGRPPKSGKKRPAKTADRSSASPFAALAALKARKPGISNPV